MDLNETAPRPADESNETALIFILRVVCLGLLIYWTLTLLSPFLAIILWSVVFTVALYPLYDYLTVRWRGPRPLVAAAITLVSLGIVFGPATWLGISLAENSRTLVQRLGDGSLSIPAPPSSVKYWPLVGPRIYDLWLIASTSLKELIETVAPQLKPVGSRLLVMAGGIGVNILKFALAIILSGFLFIPGKSLVIGTKDILCKVATRRGEEFIDIAGATIRNIARGVIGVAFLQAILAGVGFLVAGFPGAGLLSFLVLLLGIIQIGPSTVIAPAIIWYWLTRDTASAVLFTIYMIPVSLLDNVLRPLVMAHGLNLPMPLILIGLMGGTIVHGLIGLFIGPVVLAIMWQLVIVWARDEKAGAMTSSRQSLQR